MSMHFLVHFTPLPAKEAEFREELSHIVDPTRAETGCVAIRVFETLHEPPRFAIHSEWTDEIAFDHHAELPHTVRFVERAKELLTHPIEGLRTLELGDPCCRSDS